MYFAVCVPHTLPTYRHMLSSLLLILVSNFLYFVLENVGIFQDFLRAVMHKSTVMSPGVRGFIWVQK